MARRKQSVLPPAKPTDVSHREKAEAAARRAGMSRGDWLNSMIGDERPRSAEHQLSASSGMMDELPGLEGGRVREESERLRRIADVLGGPKVVGKYPADTLAAHELLERRLPNTAIKCLLEGMTTLGQQTVEGAIGMSVRTRQRREKHPTELLSQDQTARTWKLAEILTRAISVFGSRTAAEQWLAEPATGLDQRRPIDLLTTPAGVELVEDFLGRIEYGVYA